MHPGCVGCSSLTAAAILDTLHLYVENPTLGIMEAAKQKDAGGLATKEDLARLEIRLVERMASLEARITKDMADLETRLTKDMASRDWRLLAALIAIVGIAVAILKL